MVDPSTVKKAWDLYDAQDFERGLQFVEDVIRQITAAGGNDALELAPWRGVHTAFLGGLGRGDDYAVAIQEEYRLLRHHYEAGLTPPNIGLVGASFNVTHRHLAEGDITEAQRLTNETRELMSFVSEIPVFFEVIIRRNQAAIYRLEERMDLAEALLLESLSMLQSINAISHALEIIEDLQTVYEYQGRPDLVEALGRKLDALETPLGVGYQTQKLPTEKLPQKSEINNTRGP